MLNRLILIVAGISILVGDGRTAGATETGCPCGSNSPVINPFPLKWIRWGTSRVLRGTPACSIANVARPSIAISRIEPAEGGQVRGYQLIVIDDDTNRRICKGTELLGVEYVLSGGKETVVVQSMAKTLVRPDSGEIGRVPRTEYRLVYVIAEAVRPDDSLCTHPIHRDSWLSRHLRWPFGYRTPAFAPPQVSRQLDDLFEVFPDHLADYAVLIPGAEYNDNVIPQIPSSSGLRRLNIPDRYDGNGYPEFSPRRRAADKPSLEWFEYACAGGALAHTDLSGVVDIDDPQPVRTAALRMFSATYQGTEAQTRFGIPIEFSRNTQSSNPCLAHGHRPGRIEARWNENGAVCMSHSRLWKKNTLITAASSDPRKSLQRSETEFVDDFELPDCLDASAPMPPWYFTSCALDHIDD